MEAFPAIALVTADATLARAVTAQITHVYGVEPQLSDSIDSIAADCSIVVLDWKTVELHAEAIARLQKAAPLLAVIHLSPPEGNALPHHPLAANLRRPLSVPQLFRTFKALLDRRTIAQAQQSLTLADGLVFHPAEKTIACDNARIELTDKETALLSYLARNRPEWTARENLLEEVWGYGDGIDTHTLETHLYRLRSKLKPLLGEQELILTGQGRYRLNPNMLPVEMT